MTKRKKVTTSARRAAENAKKKLKRNQRVDSEHSVHGPGPEGAEENLETTQPLVTSAGKGPTGPSSETIHEKEIVEEEVPEVSPVKEKDVTPGTTEKERSPTTSPGAVMADNSGEGTSSQAPAPVDENDDSADEIVRTPISDRVSGDLFRMPTPQARVENSDEDMDERLDSADEREMEEELRRGRSPEVELGGSSGPGGQDEEMPELTDEELDEEQEEGQMDHRWKLTTGIEGGPSNPELLRGFVAHVAYSIWQGEDRKVLKGVKSYEGMLSRCIGDLSSKPEVCQFVENSRLLALNDIMYKHINMALISAFIERWHPETNSFHMPFGEVTILLHDLAYLGSLVIEGKLACDKMTVRTLQTKFASLLGVSPETVISNWKSGCVKYALIENRLKAGQGSSEKIAKLYLIWLLSSTLFIDKTKFGLVADLFPFVDNLDEVGAYNWGASTLVYLYRQLGVASRYDCASIAGCLTLLQGWIYAYFPCFRPKENKYWSVEMPWVSKWIPKFQKSTEEVLKSYRTKLDSLTPEDVDWFPFHPRPGEIHEISLYHGILQFRHIKEPYMPDRTLRQFRYVQTIPSSPYVPTVKELRWKPNAYVCEFNITPENYENFRTHSIRFDETRPVALIGEAVDEYMEWFVDRTHRRVMPEMPSSPTSSQLERVVDILYEAHPSIRGKDVEPHPYVNLIDRLCGELGPFFAARGIGKACKKGKGKKKR